MTTLKFGKHIGKTLDQCPTEYLQFLVDKFLDVNDPKFGANNQRMKDECQAILDSRGNKQNAPYTPPRRSGPGPSMTASGASNGYRVTQEQIDDLKQFIERIYNAAYEAQTMLNEITFDTKDHNPF